MKSPQNINPTKPVISTTDARQGNAKESNLRVLTMSLVMAVAVGALLVGAFWFTTSADIDASSGAPAGENTQRVIVPDMTAPTSTETVPPPTSTDTVPAQAEPPTAPPVNPTPTP